MGFFTVKQSFYSAVESKFTFVLSRRDDLPREQFVRKDSGIGMLDTPLFHLNRVHGLPLVRLHGELDCYHAPLIKDRLLKLIENGDSDLILDLNGVDFVDSSGLSLMVSVHQRTLAHGGSLRVLCTNRALWHVFEITGLQRAFPVFHEEVALMTSLDAK